MRSSCAAIEFAPLPTTAQYRRVERVALGDGGDLVALVDDRVPSRRAARAARRATRARPARVERSDLVGERRARAGIRPRSARRTPSSTRRSSPRRARRTCRARRRTCRRGRCCGGSRSRRPLAPRARTRSTVRFVSVVVPLWLIATTSVSDMSPRSPKPESSVAGSASTRNGVARRRGRAPRRGSGPPRPPCPGRSRGPGGSRRRAAVRGCPPGASRAGARPRAARRARRSCRAASCGTRPAPRGSP